MGVCVCVSCAHNLLDFSDCSVASSRLLSLLHEDHIGRDIVKTVECDWKDILSVTALLIVYTLLSSTYQVLKGVAVLVSSLKVGRYQREVRVYGGVEWSEIREVTGVLRK